MTNRDLTLALRLSADSSRLMGGLAKGETGLRKFGSAAKREMDALGNFAGSVEGKLAQIGLGVSAIAAGMQSAQLDKDLKQLQLTAGATAEQADVLRKSLLDAQIATGQGVDELKGGVDALVAGGLSLGEATAAVTPMAETLAVSKTNADALAKAMGVAATQFDIDLSKTEEARLLLDKMVVAGRAGNAELENLPDIFARVGNSAKSSNLSLDQTLALVETLSMVEPNAERLGTLTDSTLRVFTNANYMKDAQKATGVKFFDKDGSRRDALEVIQDIKGQYDKLDTDAQRFKFINSAFGKTDLDTQRGLKTLLDGDSLSKLDKVFADVSSASGTIARDLPDAIGNAVDQTNRLKGALRQAADDFAKPVNETLSGLIKWGMDSKENGGLGLDGKDMLLGGAVGAAGLFGAARYGGKAVSGLLGKLGGVGAGVATGKALEEAAGVQPVYVVNMPADGIGGKVGTVEKVADAAGDLLGPKTFSKLKTTLALVGGAPLSALPSMDAGALATAGAGVVAAGAAGYGAGTLINDYLLTDQGPLGSAFGARLADNIGEGIALLLSPFSEEASRALAVNRAAERDTEMQAAALKDAMGVAGRGSAGDAELAKASSLPNFDRKAMTATGPLAQGAVIPGSVLQEAALKDAMGVAGRGSAGDAELAKASSLPNFDRKAMTATGPLAQGTVIPGSALQEATSGLTEQVRQAIAGAKPQPAEVSGRIEVQINSEGRPRVSLLQSQGGVDLTAYTGRTGAGS